MSLQSIAQAITTQLSPSKTTTTPTARLATPDRSSLSPSRRASSLVMTPSGTGRYGLSLKDRARMLQAYSRCVLTLYSDANRLIPLDGLNVVGAEASQAWEQLQFFKRSQLSIPKEKLAHFLVLEDFIDAAAIQENEAEWEMFKAALHNSNAASFAHLAYQLPENPPSSNVSDNTAVEATWPIRDVEELVEAQRAFWATVVPIGGSTVYCFQNAVEVYVALTRQIAIQRMQAEAGRQPSQAALRKAVESCYTSEYLAAALSDGLDANQAKKKQKCLKDYADAAKQAVDELLNAKSDVIETYKLLDTASACAAYANAAALYVWRPQEPKEVTERIVNEGVDLHADLSEKGSRPLTQSISELDDMPSAAQRPSDRWEPLMFGPGMQLQKRTADADQARFPAGEVAQRIETEFDDGDSDVFLDKIREAAANNNKSTEKSRKRKKKGDGDYNIVAREVMEEREVENLPQVDVDDDFKGDEHAGLTTRSRRKGKKKAADKHSVSETEPTRRSRRRRVRESAAGSPAQAEGAADADPAPAIEVAEVEEPAPVNTTSEGKTADFEEDLDDNELQQRQEEAREQRKRLRALEKERARIDAELASVRAGSLPITSELRPKSRVPQRRLDLEFSDSEAPPIKERKATPSTSQGNLNRYATGGNRNGRVVWSAEETQCLLMAIDKIYETFKRDGGLQGSQSTQIYLRILQLHGPNGSESTTLAARNNLQLKDKVRNEIRRRRRDNEPNFEWKDAFFPNF